MHCWTYVSLGIMSRSADVHSLNHTVYTKDYYQHVVTLNRCVNDLFLACIA